MRCTAVPHHTYISYDISYNTYVFIARGRCACSSQTTNDDDGDVCACCCFKTANDDTDDIPYNNHIQNITCHMSHVYISHTTTQLTRERKREGGEKRPSLPLRPHTGIHIYIYLIVRVMQQCIMYEYPWHTTQSKAMLPWLLAAAAVWCISSTWLVGTARKQRGVQKLYRECQLFYFV